MRTFRVWAPRAVDVDLVIGDARHPMAPAGVGWFACEIGGVADGTEYSFGLDNQDARPDPRSRSQPAGVHGPSQLVELEDAPNRDWRGFPLEAAIIYEVHVGTFTHEGTFDACIERLDHLTSLGINAIELMPLAQYPGSRGWGYDGVDLFAPHSAYGGPEGLRRLVDACHRRGIAVIVDVVYNHLGPEGDYLPEFGPYFTDRYATPWGTAFNYDGEDSDAVRAFVIENAEMWLREYGCDGLRLDAVHAIIDMSPTHILEALATRVADLSVETGRHLWVIAESDSNDPRLVRDRAAGGYGLDAQWNDDFHHALHALITGESFGYYEDFHGAADVCTALQEAFVYAGSYSRHRKRTVGRSTAGLPLSRFVVYSQNHDQVGNRAAGERLCHLISDGRARMAAALTLLSPMIPLLFQGEEWAAGSPFQYFTDLEDRGLGRAVTSGRRQEFRSFGWPPESVPDPQNPETFLRSRLDWDEIGRTPHVEMLAWYRALIAIRRATPALSARGGDAPRAWYDATRIVLLYAHAGLLVACNLGDNEAALPEAANASLLLTSAPMPGGGMPRIAAESASVWRTS
ncbi:MAG: malto-oligosyltrehalose trehalohydrolase [Candidatus Dormiibacterota bacterium]